LTSKEAAKAVLYIELAKPPFIPELVKLAVERAPPSKISLGAERVLQAKLETARSLEELESTLLELFTRDISGIIEYLVKTTRYMPVEYAEYFKILVEISELELLYSKLASGVLEEKPLYYVKLEDYRECMRNAKFSCVVLKHIARLIEKCEKTCEECGRALVVTALFDLLFYTRYLSNLRKLGLEEDLSLRQLVKSVLEHVTTAEQVYVEPSLTRILEAAQRGGDSLEAWCNSVLALYEEAKFLLYYTNRLVDILTLYGVDRVLRYMLLRLLHSRWLIQW